MQRSFISSRTPVFSGLCGILVAATLSWGCTLNKTTDTTVESSNLTSTQLTVGAIPDQDPEKLQRMYVILEDYLSDEQGVPFT